VSGISPSICHGSLDVVGVNSLTIYSLDALDLVYFGQHSIVAARLDAVGFRMILDTVLELKLRARWNVTVHRYLYCNFVNIIPRA
jgi:hypothetical protein